MTNKIEKLNARLVIRDDEDLEIDLLLLGNYQYTESYDGSEVSFFPH